MTTATTTTTIALQRVQGIVGRAQSGKVHTAVAMRMVETFAPALPLAVYDAAVDAVAEAAEQQGQSLDINTVEIDRPKSTRPDSATRRARRHAAKTHASGTRKGRHLAPGQGIESTVAEHVTAAMPWRTKVTTSPAESLRPIWAVGTGVHDGAEVFALVGTGRNRDAVVIPNHAYRVRSVAAECSPIMASGKPVGLSVPALTASQRRAGMRVRDLLAVAEESDKAEAVRQASAYQRNGWAH
jgi:hypothetical protein